MTRYSLPTWASNTLYEKNLAFEVKGLDIKIWQKFTTDHHGHDPHELPALFGPYVDSLIASKWVEAARESLIPQRQTRKQPREIQRGALDVLEDKINNFFLRKAQSSQIVEYNVTAQCIYCNRQSPVMRTSLIDGFIICPHCGEHSKI